MQEIRQAAEEFAGQVAEELGGRLRSVVLYGSVARQEAVPDVSDVNLLVLVDTVDAGLLRGLAPRIRDWLATGRAVPDVLTWAEWSRASDAFAIETADLLDARVVLYGDDPVRGAAVERRHLRVQVERELRGKLIQFREGLLATADRPEDLGRLVLRVLPSMATYLRAALRLAGQDIKGSGTPDVLRRGCELIDVDPAPALELWGARTGRKAPDFHIDDPKVTAVHQILERTTDYVDSLSGDKLT